MVIYNEVCVLNTLTRRQAFLNLFIHGFWEIEEYKGKIDLDECSVNVLVSLGKLLNLSEPLDPLPKERT